MTQVEAPISRNLLENEGLLTPVLQKHFGHIYAEELDFTETVNMYFRKSILLQKTTNLRLLNANLTIIKNALPASLLYDLRCNPVPFGELLQNYEIKVEIHDRRWLVVKDYKDQALRLGRRHVMFNLRTKSPLCCVQELLVPERKLSAIKSSV